MSKKTVKIVLILVLVIVIGFLLYFYFHKKVTTTNTNGDTNTFSGFGKNNNNSNNNSTTDVSGSSSGDTTVIPPKLRKISSMPIAGFGVYNKERIKVVQPVISQNNNTTTETNTTTKSTNENNTNNTTPATPKTTTVDQKYTVVINGKKVIKTRKVTVVVKTPSVPTEIVPAVRYVARATGNIYETFTDILNEQKFSATVIPKVYDAYFDAKAESVIMRYLKSDDATIETFAGTLPKELLGSEVAGDKELKGSFLPEGITDISVSPDKSKIFYLFTLNGFASGIVSGFSGDARVQVFDSPFTEWLSNWANQNTITFTTKPTYGLPGYMYTVDPTKKNSLLTQSLSKINGLTTLTSPDGKSILYSNNKLILYIYNLVNKSIVTLAVNTESEKCVWGKTNDVVYCAVPKSIPQGLYPDSWYKGEVSFSDSLWKINTTDGSATLLVDPITIPGGEDIDGIKLSLDKDENYLFFVNKKDSFLWEFDLRP